MLKRRADIAVVGAGILGLAHAYHAAASGKRVVLFERHAAASGASIRNFGLIWPIGQPHGEMLETALDSARYWRQVLHEAGIPFHDTGSLHLTYREDEQAVAEEFASLSAPLGYQCRWISPAETARHSPSVIRPGLRGALFSRTEFTIDPRLTVARLPGFLASRHHVITRFGHAVQAIQLPRIHTTRETWEVDQAIVCSGDDFETLYPALYKDSGIVRCKLQMLRTVPQPEGWSLGPALAAGLTLRFYPSFQICESLSPYRRRVASETPELDRWGIHVMASETAGREVTIGDSHEYNNLVDIFNREEIDEAILTYLRSFLSLPDPAIAQRWHGVYAKHAEKPYIRFQPEPGVTVVTAAGGAGMTLSFGLAAATCNREFIHA